MDIAKTTAADIEILKSWFPDQASSYFWCGPGLRFPHTHDSFLEDIHWEKMPSYSLIDDDGAFAGFGQYYEKAGRCHLARLAISPYLRGRGHGQRFIARLMAVGMQDLDKNTCSLFVVRSNVKALQCYTALGFNKEAYPPGHQHFADIDFMVYTQPT